MTLDADGRGGKAIERQPAPTGVGADITDLAKQDVASLELLVPEQGLSTVYLWVRSSTAYIRDRLRYLEDVRALSKDLMIDLEARARMGEAKYGTRLKAHNGRDALVDLYQELLDAWVYLRQHIEEQKIRK